MDREWSESTGFEGGYGDEGSGYRGEQMTLMIRFLSSLERIRRFSLSGLLGFAVYTNILFFSLMSCLFIQFSCES